MVRDLPSYKISRGSNIQTKIMLLALIPPKKDFSYKVLVSRHEFRLTPETFFHDPIFFLILSSFYQVYIKIPCYFPCSRSGIRHFSENSRLHFVGNCLNNLNMVSTVFIVTDVSLRAYIFRI